MANGGANTYGGRDSWNDYDNTNTMTPYQQATAMANAPVRRTGTNPKTGMATMTRADKRAERYKYRQIEKLSDSEGRQ